MVRPPLVLETWGEIRVYREGSKRFVARARYRDVDGRTRDVERTGATENKARDRLKEAMRDRLKPAGSEELKRDSTLEQLAGLWWEEFTARPHAVGTLRRYETVRRLHVVGKIGGWRIEEASTGKLDRFIKLLTQEAGYSSAALAAVQLRAMLDLAARHDVIDANPMASIAEIVEPAHEIRSYTMDDVAELRWILSKWDAGADAAGRQRVSDLADPVDMFLGTGWRPAEIFALPWDLVDFTNPKAVAELSRTMAKSLQGKWVIQYETKGHKILRYTLPLFVSEMLLRRRVNSTSELVFPSSTGTPRIPDNFRTQWHAALAGTKFQGHTPKEFRSTVATRLRDEIGIERAQHQLGHASLTTTEESYARPVVDVPDSSDQLEAFNVMRSPEAR